MKQLSLTDTQALVNSYVKTFGQRGAARKLTEHGYRSPEGHEIRQGHVTRIMNGSYTMLQAPEEPVKEPVPAPVSTPEAAYSIGEPTPARYLERGPASEDQSESSNASGSVKEAGDLEDLSIRLEDGPQMPALVPHPSDHTRSEHSHLQRDVRVSAIFNRRGEVKLDEDRGDYFGLPRLRRQPPKTITKPYEPRSYAKLSTSPMEPYKLQSKRV
jgi:hypothetical protein